MKAFTVYRPNAPESHAAEQKNAPDRPQFQGVVFDDGKVTVRWLTACRSVSVWDSMDDLLKIHGRPEYGTVIVWHEVTEGRETETETETEIEARHKKEFVGVTEVSLKSSGWLEINETGFKKQSSNFFLDDPRCLCSN